MKDEEIIDLIVNLFALHVPDSLGKRLVLEKLNRSLFLEHYKCLGCGKDLVCLDCDPIEITHDTDITVHIGNRSFSV